MESEGPTASRTNKPWPLSDAASGKLAVVVGSCCHVCGMDMESFPEAVTSCQITCALRFDGYRYLDSWNEGAPQESRIEFMDLTVPVVELLELYENRNHNFAAFFALQRYLFKWGGERLTKYADEHIAFDFLFLELYRHDPPEEFLLPSYAENWRELPAADIEKHAAFVRKSFARTDAGPKCR